MSDTKPKWAGEIAALGGHLNADRPAGYLTTREVADAAGICVGRLYSWIQRFRIEPHHKANRGRNGTNYWDPERLAGQLRAAFQKAKRA